MKISRIVRHLLTPAWQVRNKFSATALARIEQAIRESETRHAGQIRFAVEHALEPGAVWRGETAGERALQVFSLLRVWDTEHNNGVLIYLLLADRDIEIIADRGIHRHIGAPAWEAICQEMESAFRAGRFEEGVIAGIERVSRHLESHFPRAAGTDNELPDAAVVL
ncbi:MAG TPA: TPM domain-containing protein [Burkholderiales bacterium]